MLSHVFLLISVGGFGGRGRGGPPGGGRGGPGRGGMKKKEGYK